MSLNGTALYVVKFNIEKTLEHRKNKKTITRFTLLHCIILNCNEDNEENKDNEEKVEINDMRV